MAKTVKMTELERNLLEAVWTSNFHDGAYPVNNAVWTNCATETLGRSAQGAITSARKKGWVGISGSTTEDRVIWITEEGARMLASVNETVRNARREKNAREETAKMERLRKMVAEGVNEGEPVKTKPRLNEEQAQAIKEALMRLLPVAAALQNLAVGSELDNDTATDYADDVQAAARQLMWLADELFRE